MIKLVVSRLREIIIPTPEQAAIRAKRDNRNRLIVRLRPQIELFWSRASQDPYAAEQLWLHLNSRNELCPDHYGIKLSPTDFGHTDAQLQQILIWACRGVWSRAQDQLEHAEDHIRWKSDPKQVLYHFEESLDAWFPYWPAGRGRMIMPYCRKLEVDVADVCIVSYVTFIERMIKMWIRCHQLEPTTFYFGGRFAELCRLLDKDPEDFGVTFEDLKASWPPR